MLSDEELNEVFGEEAANSIRAGNTEHHWSLFVEQILSNGSTVYSSLTTDPTSTGTVIPNFVQQNFDAPLAPHSVETVVSNLNVDITFSVTTNKNNDITAHSTGVVDAYGYSDKYSYKLYFATPTLGPRMASGAAVKVGDSVESGNTVTHRLTISQELEANDIPLSLIHISEPTRPY